MENIILLNVLRNIFYRAYNYKGLFVYFCNL